MRWTSKPLPNLTLAFLAAIRRSAPRWLADARMVLAAALATLAVGCGPQIEWQIDTFDRVHAAARRDQKATLVYFRHWASVECTRFEDSLLRDPDVVTATRPLACVMLDYGWDQPLAERWKIDKIPAVVIVNLDGSPIEKLMEPIRKAELLAAIQRALGQKQTPAESAAPRSNL